MAISLIGRRGLLALGGAACGLSIASTGRPSSAATAPLPAALVDDAETEVVVENWSSSAHSPLRAHPRAPHAVAVRECFLLSPLRVRC